MSVTDMNEWEFAAEVAGWINQIIADEERLPFSSVRCEQQSKDSRRRRDLTLFDRDRKIVLTGEIKLPYRPDGGSPYNEKLVQDARRKAMRAKSPYFFTWNVNECVLWETFPARTAQKDRKYTSWDVTEVHKPSHLSVPSTTHAIQYWLPKFLDDFAQILRGRYQIGTQSPDEKFIDALESHLNMPIILTLAELQKHYNNAKFREKLDKWMREEQGWVIYDDPEGILDNLERASKFACYALVNKIVFREALLKRYKSKMDKLSVPEHMAKGDELRLHLEGHFTSAMETTGDYETVFGEEHKGIGNRIPFYSDHAVAHWRELINQIHRFDFSQLDYEVIGNIFERLISPDERHKYGQFYTRVEVVDLINSFCIRDGKATIMDPACGGGTFLVRAYARKRELAPNRQHHDLLLDLYGTDVSHFAAHLTTINLATRNLVDDENYPQIARSDFFEVAPENVFLTVPHHAKAKGLGKTSHRKIKIPQLDAVVGNPPYIRQEDIPQNKKNAYRKLVNDTSKAGLSGRSDIHCYFWPHAAAFLKEGGYLCFLTSSQWLDVEYGFRLQEWILRNFEIIAIVESLREPWFVGARVVTAITILRRQKDESVRMNNSVRFVQLRRMVKDMFAHDGTTAGAVEVVDSFRDEILSVQENTSTEAYRVRLVRQGDLWDNGVQQGILTKRSNDGGSDDPEAQDGDYYGGKWGVHLRAPDSWFRLIEEYGARIVPLAEIADVWRGITSGKDCFFFPRDCSDECLDTYGDRGMFELEYGVPRKDVKSGKVKLVLCGEGRGEVRPIEGMYLEPEVHSLMEIRAYTATPEDCKYQILLVDKPKSEIQGTYVLDYIEWGEKNGYHEGSTCASRASSDREWYDLTGHRRGQLFWPMAQQYKHVIPCNVHNLICNHNLFDISSDDVEMDVLGGILNSSWVVLSKFQYGRPVGVEGNLKTEVVDVKMMRVPDPRDTTPKTRERVAAAFNELKKRPPMQFLSERRMREMAYHEAGKKHELRSLCDICELDMEDRRELDDAVLKMLGVRRKEQRERLIDSLYLYLKRFFESVRQKEEKAILNKKRAKRRGQTDPRAVAVQVYEDIVDKDPGLLRHYRLDFLDSSKPFDSYELPLEGVAGPDDRGLINGHGILFKKGKKVTESVDTKIPEQDDLLILLANSGSRGIVQVPHEPEECLRVFRSYEEFVNRRDRQIWEMIERRTADEELQEKIYRALMPMLLSLR